jgi:hypothetical protein
MLTRRDVLRAAASELASYAVLGASWGVVEARKLRITTTSVVWEFGPPGTVLQRWVDELADDLWPGSGWRDPEHVRLVGGWHEAWRAAAERPFVFNDQPYRGDLWTNAEDYMDKLAWWAHLKIKWS